ncbi:hypothetical protein TSST111916_05225 [Tsukamurella strandjordii]
MTSASTLSTAGRITPIVLRKAGPNSVIAGPIHSRSAEYTWVWVNICRICGIRDIRVEVSSSPAWVSRGIDSSVPVVACHIVLTISDSGPTSAILLTAVSDRKTSGIEVGTDTRFGSTIVPSVRYGPAVPWGANSTYGSPSALSCSIETSESTGTWVEFGYFRRTETPRVSPSTRSTSPIRTPRSSTDDPVTSCEERGSCRVTVVYCVPGRTPMYPNTRALRPIASTATKVTMLATNSRFIGPPPASGASSRPDRPARRWASDRRCRAGPRSPSRPR